jgi:hypothetical protein
VFAWTQNRFLLPSWYGAGTALGRYTSTDEGMAVLREMYEGWPFFHTLLDFMQMTLAKSDLRIAEHYSSLVSNPATRDRLWTRISEEHADCVRALLLITKNERTSSTTVPSYRGPYAFATRTWTRSPTFRSRSCIGFALSLKAPGSARVSCIPCCSLSQVFPPGC